LKCFDPSGPPGPEGVFPERLPRVRVWDAPTRLFHWTLAAAFAGEWLTRDARYIDLHEFLGYAIALLVAFRLFWGVAGTRWARFASFRPTVAGAARHLASLARRTPEHHAGHNPAGSWAIHALLVLAVLQVATGLVTLGAEERLGPLSGRFSYALGDSAHAVHEALAWAMLGVVALHVAGVIAGSILERQNLVASMLTGLKRASAASAVEAKRGVAFALAAVLGMAALAYFRGDAFDARAQPRAVPLLVQDAEWASQCGDCHMAYHPSLLPARSWAALLARGADHFGEDLSLDDATRVRLAMFAARNAAEAHASPAAWKIATTTPPANAPERITDTPYWKQRHARVAEIGAVRASDCGACHRDADGGSFSPRAIRVARAVPGKGS
jgi:cytochrome b